MRTLRSDVSTAEWRWVIVISGILVALTLVPYAWALARNETNDSWQFMGMLSNPTDGATYLSKIEQGKRGMWLFQLRYTPERHDGAGFHAFYLFLGHAARITGLSNLIVFHLARVVTSFFMYLSLYYLGATVWVRLRPRRLFFILTALGSGLGWLLMLVDPAHLGVDMTLPEAFPFYASYANAHFPLSIASLAMIAAIYLAVFRRGFDEAPSVENGGLTLMLLSVVLALVQPVALVPIGGALVLYVIVRYWLTREFPTHELRWASMLWLPAIPFALYDIFVFRFNSAMRVFNQQNQTPSPAVYQYLFGFGLLLVVALPGLVRAVRRFERDGDQLMLLWLIVNVVGLYMPFNRQRRLAMGLILPLGYFAVRALEDYWFYHGREKWRVPAMMALIVLLLPTNVLVLGIPLFGAVVDPDSGLDAGLLLESDYVDAIRWLRNNAEADEVVLAAPKVSLWIPAYTDLVVVYGHPFETIHAEERLAQVEAWYRGEDCDTLLSDDLPFRVRYIFWGPQERALAREDADGHTYPNAGKCIETLPEERVAQVVEKGDVTIYVLR